MRNRSTGEPHVETSDGMRLRFQYQKLMRRINEQYGGEPDLFWCGFNHRYAIAFTYESMVVYIADHGLDPMVPPGTWETWYTCGASDEPPMRLTNLPDVGLALDCMITTLNTLIERNQS